MYAKVYYYFLCFATLNKKSKIYFKGMYLQSDLSTCELSFYRYHFVHSEIGMPMHLNCITMYLNCMPIHLNCIRIDSNRLFTIGINFTKIC